MIKGKNDLSKWLILYGLVIMSFHILPVLFSGYVQKPITYGDILDFVTPFAVIPVVFFLHSRICRIGSDPVSPTEYPNHMSKIVLGVGLILYVEGHGLHLSANSLARLFDRIKNPEFFNVAYLFDEIISHYVWDLGVFLISIALIIASYRIPRLSQSPQNYCLICAGAACYGFTFTVNGIEGQTVVFAIPAALLGVVVSGGKRFKISQDLVSNPIRMFFLLAYTISLFLFVYWGIWHSGYPQFSELGWI
jgi:hypothetical protein